MFVLIARLGKITAAILSTSLALAFSFYMNRNYVFSARDGLKRHQILPFLTVALTGSFIILNGVYVLSLGLIDHHTELLVTVLQNIPWITISDKVVEAASINLSLEIGAIVAMAWNYLGYKYFVFRKKIPDTSTDATKRSL